VGYSGVTSKKALRKGPGLHEGRIFMKKILVALLAGTALGCPQLALA